MSTKTEAQKIADSYALEELPLAIDSYTARDARYAVAGNHNTPLARFNRACINAMRERLSN